MRNKDIHHTVIVIAPLKLRPYGAIQMCILLLLLLLPTTLVARIEHSEAGVRLCVRTKKRLNEMTFKIYPGLI